MLLLLLSGTGFSAAGQITATTPDGRSSLGSIAGTIDYQGEVPTFHITDNTGRLRPLLQVGKAGRGLQYAVVYLKPVDGKAPPEDKATTNKAPPAVTIDQVDETFVPHLTAVRVGQEVVFTNSDHANHSVRTATLVAENQFNVVVGPTQEYVHRFRAARKTRPVGLLCDIHPWMRGWIYVFDQPYFAVTDRKGKFRIDNVPTGQYRLAARQPDVGFAREREIQVVASKTTRAHFTFRQKDVKRFKPVTKRETRR